MLVNHLQRHVWLAQEVNSREGLLLPNWFPWYHDIRMRGISRKRAWSASIGASLRSQILWLQRLKQLWTSYCHPPWSQRSRQSSLHQLLDTGTASTVNCGSWIIRWQTIKLGQMWYYFWSIKQKTAFDYAPSDALPSLTFQYCSGIGAQHVHYRLQSYVL